MATLNESAVVNGRRAGFCRLKKHNPKTDMTPMVDLGFLLIAFFVITAELSKPRVTNLIMPKDGDSTKLKDINALTIVDGNNKVWYYHGNMNDAIMNNRIVQTSFSPKDGIRKIIIDKQKALDKINPAGKGRNELFLVIKATADADYGKVIDALDEALINDVRKYALLKTDKAESDYLKTLKD